MLQMERGAPMTRETVVYNAASNALWLQRETLQTLLFRLVCEKLVLTSGSHRWLARADDEVHAAVERLRSGELLRAAEVDELVRMLGLDADASLGELAAAAPEPWGTLLADHRAALRTLAFEVQGVADENADLQDLDRAEGTLQVSTANVTYQAALETTANVRQLSLLDFLR
jgi:hypothetical protein